MVDFNDKNFLLADVERDETTEFQIRRAKQNIRDALTVAIVLAILWVGTAVLATLA